MVDEERSASQSSACPKHSEKAALFEVLDATNSIDVKLTENYAMWPGAAVSGGSTCHTSTANIFAVAKLEKDSGRRLCAAQELEHGKAERWLAPNLG